MDWKILLGIAAIGFCSWVGGFIMNSLPGVLRNASDNKLKREQEKTKQAEFGAHAAANTLETERLRSRNQLETEHRPQKHLRD